MLAEYKKALVPAALAALAVVVELTTSGTWNRVETATAFTAFIAAGTTALVPNIPSTTLAWRALKAVVPAFVTFSAALAIYIETDAFDKGALVVFLTGAGSAVVTLLLANGGRTNEVGSLVGSPDPRQPLGLDPSKP